MKKDSGAIKFFFLQLMVCVVLLLIVPCITLLLTHKYFDAKVIFNILIGGLIPCYVTYFLNYYVLVPLLLFKGKKLYFFGANIASILLVNLHILIGYIHSYNYMSSPDSQYSQYASFAWYGMATGYFLLLLFNVAAASVAFAIRTKIRNREIKEQLSDEKQRHTEAELHWLKNQLNPHFLFNTLNNISSLAQIDIDLTQDSIARLSDLLRYAMYETEKPTVPLEKEVEFMRNYIALMELRCNDKTTVTTSFEVSDPSAQITPLLLISFIENAFKHGISSNRPSFINVSLHEENNRLTFICDNSNFPKDETDHSGKGIGLSNMKRRLELLYPGRYELHQSLENDIYHISLNIKLCEKSVAQ